MLANEDKAVALEALESHRAHIYDVVKNTEEMLDGLDAIDRAIAAINAEAEWEKVPDGEYKHEGNNEQLTVGTTFNNGRYLKIKSALGWGLMYELPDGWALVRTQEAIDG